MLKKDHPKRQFQPIPNQIHLLKLSNKLKEMVDRRSALAPYPIERVEVPFDDGKTIIVEIKPDKETTPPKRPDKSKRYINEAMTYVKNMNKWEAANSYAKDRGWEFQIWTEETLYSMGIMKKLKGLKPLKPYRKKRKK